VQRTWWPALCPSVFQESFATKLAVSRATLVDKGTSGLPANSAVFIDAHRRNLSSRGTKPNKTCWGFEVLTSMPLKIQIFWNFSRIVGYVPKLPSIYGPSSGSTMKFVHSSKTGFLESWRKLQSFSKAGNSLPNLTTQYPTRLGMFRTQHHKISRVKIELIRN